MLVVLSFSIRPGRVPDCRALLRAAGPAPGQIDCRFVEIGVVNTILILASAKDGAALETLGRWASARWDEALHLDFLRGISCEAFAGDAPEGLANAPCLLMERGSADGLPALLGEVGARLNLLPQASLDDGLAAAAARRQQGMAGRNALLIPERLGA